MEFLLSNKVIGTILYAYVARIFNLPEQASGNNGELMVNSNALDALLHVGAVGSSVVPSGNTSVTGISSTVATSVAAVPGSTPIIESTYPCS